MKKIAILSILMSMFFFNIHAQIKVGKNQKTINPNALFEMESDTSGILMPRIALVSTSSFLPLKAHVHGMVVYNTAVAFSGTDSALVKGFYYNNGSKWMRLATSSDEPWRVANTTRNADSNSQNIYQMGNVGIGTNSPTISLEVAGKATDSSSRDGVIFPRVTGDQLKSKDNLYDFTTKGVVLYVTNAVTTPSAKTINVTGDGFYYFDGSVWIKLEDNVTNIYSVDGTIGSNRKVAIADLVSFDNQTFNISSGLHAVGVGISTPDSSAVLEVYSKTQGFLPPRMTNAEMNAIVSPEEGLMVYCYDCKPIGMYNYSPNKWVPIADAILEDAVFSSGTLNCQSGVAGSQTGTYSQGLAMSTTNTKTVLVTVLSVGKFTAKTDTVNGVTWEQVAPSIFSVGANSQIKLQAKGSPLSVGTYTYTLTVSGGLSCTFTMTYTSPATFDCSNLTQTDLSPSSLYLVNGSSYTQTITVPYTAGNASPYGGSVSTSQGLTLSRVAGTYAAGGGSVTYNLTGTYTGTTGSNFVTFTTPDGFCPIQVNAHSVSLVANAGTSLQIDNIKVIIPTSSYRSQQIASVRKAATFVGGSSYAMNTYNSGAIYNLSINTTTSAWTYVAAWSFGTVCDEQISYLRDNSNNHWYRITTVIGGGYNNNLLHIERMDANIAGISNGTFANRGVTVSLDNLKAQIPASGNTALQLGTISGTFATTSLGGYSPTTGNASVQVNVAPALSTTFSYVKSTNNLSNVGQIEYGFVTDNTNTYKATIVIGPGYANNLVHLEKLNATTPMSISSFANKGVDLALDNVKIRMAASGNASKQISSVSGTYNIDFGSQAYYSTAATVINAFTGGYSVTATPTLVVAGWFFNVVGGGQITILRNYATNKYYKSHMIVGLSFNNNFLYLKRY